MTAPITASMLYDLVACPHRVTMDQFGDPSVRDEPNAFVELLWDKGSLYEREVICRLDADFLDLSTFSGEEKEQLTLEAMQRGVALIYSGRIRADNLVGEPDLLRIDSTGYVAGDIKSGSGEEGPDDSPRPKLHYAVQLGLYTDILERRGFSRSRRAFIWDIRGVEVSYDFIEPYGQRIKKTLWEDYQEALHLAEAIVSGSEQTLPAYSAACKLCHWYSVCTERLKATDDLTTIPELGRSKRDEMYGSFKTVNAFAALDPEAFITGKKTSFAGVGPDSLHKFHERAKLLSTPGSEPYLRTAVALPDDDLELFFDIEVDPMRDICYLHGFIERRSRNNSTETFVAFFADSPSQDSEKRAFAEAIAYLRAHRPCAIYYYSKYERTIYRKLQGKYPSVCSAEEIEDLFDPSHAIDLYNDVVKKSTEWPTWDHSIKTIAKYLGFQWRDTHPSGAASIEWFNRWVETGDAAVRQRILDYNEDDCRATRVLRDAIATLQVKPGGEA